MSSLVNSLFVEFLGTFIFLSVILKVGEPLPIVVALAAVIYWGGSISGGHFNPAVSIMMFLKGNKNILTTLLYITCQIIGAIVAFYYVTKVIKDSKN